ncbi:MAG: ABC transporter ATP-binding protein [Clostridia bacterium]
MKQAATLKKVLKYTEKYKKLTILSMLLAAATVALTLAVPVLTGRAIDLIVQKGLVDFAGIGVILLEIGACVLATCACQWLMNVTNNRITYGMVRDIRATAFQKLTVLPLGYLDSHASGGLVSRVIADVDQFSEGLLMGFTQLFTGVMTIVGTLFVMLKVNYQIALVVILVTPASLFVAKFIAKHTYDMFCLQSETRAEQTALIDEMINGQKVVVAFGQEDAVVARFDEINARLEACSRRAVFFSSITNPATRFINGLVYAGVGVAGALSVLSGGLTVGVLTCFLSYANQYTKPFNEISGVMTEFQNALACAGRVFDLIDEKEQRPDAQGARVLQDARGEIAVSDVSFSYDPARKLIEHMNLMVRPGERIAIVGPTGCGKTTLINLLMRFYDVDAGAISVDGTDVRELTRESLRKHYGMVLQETWLKTGTIRENVTLGRPDATDEEVIAACKAAHAHGFITRLGDGYATRVTEDGGGLSQGEKQLLSIARVMLCLPPMLILDEATSSIDTRTEARIQAAFSRMMEGRTSFIVAHRLSTIRSADMIVVMRDGLIVEQGTHAALMANKGFYAALYESQFAH